MKSPKEMTIKELVWEFRMERRGDKIGTFYPPSDPQRRDELMERMKAQKPEIMQYLIDQENEKARTAQERQDRIDAIPGLKELKDAIEDLRKWNEEFEQNWERGDSGVGLRPRPQYDLDAMRAKYPRATGYLAAESMALSPNYVKAASGQKALNRIIEGEDHVQALADAKAEWDAYVQEHIWD